MGVEYRNGVFIIYLINFLAFPFYKTYKKYLWEVGDRIVEIIGIIWWWGVNNIVCIRKRPYDDCGKCGEIVLFRDRKVVNDGR